MTDSESLPAEISSSIGVFFAIPMKPDREGKLHDIRRSSLQQSEANTLARLIIAEKPERIIEIGMAAAGSTVAIAAARKYSNLPGRHIVLDPFQETLSLGAGLLELDRQGLREIVDWRPQRSEEFLHSEAIDGKSYDLAFVDGGHDVGQKVTDAFYLDKVVRPGGVIAFHDAFLPSTAAAVYYLVREKGYEMLRLPSDHPIRSALRRIRYSLRISFWYGKEVVPCVCRSLVAMRKPPFVGANETPRKLEHHN